MIKVQSPTRIDLAGGTLDCWPIYAMFPSACVVNLSIPIYTQVELQFWDTKSIEIHNGDYEKTFKDLDEFLDCRDRSVALTQTVAKYFQPEQGFQLKTSSQSPQGAGLGGSSSLYISLIKAFLEGLNAEKNIDAIVNLASNLEAQLLHTPTGTQDYYPALQEGLNIIDYHLDGPQVQVIKDTALLQELRSRMTVVYTGEPHHSGLNNWQVVQSVIAKEPSTQKTLKQLVVVAQEIKTAILQKDISQLGALFIRETDLRLQLTPHFSSPHIDAVKKHALAEGAEAVKICGAGGGGCVFAWSAPEKRAQIADRMQSEGYQVLSIDKM